MIKKLSLIVFIMLILVPISLAITNYNESGNFNALYDSEGRGIFGTSDLSQTTFPDSLTATKNVPLVADLDNDGDNEIIVFDQDNVLVYGDSQLTLNTTFDVGVDERTSNVIIFDIDGDGLPEIIFAQEESEALKILNFSDTDGLQLQQNFSLSVLQHEDGEFMLKCGQPNDCLLVSIDLASSDINAAAKIRAYMFNSTAIDTTDLLIETHNGAGNVNRNGNFCLSNIRSITYADCENDGDNDFIFTYARVSEFASDPTRLTLICLDTNSGIAPPVLVQTITRDSDVFDTAGSFTCTSANVGRFFTSPAVFDIKSNIAGNEKVVGMSSTTSKFAMFSFEADGSFLDDYPEIENAEGEIVSNIMRFNAFPDTGDVDFCIVGYDFADENELDLVCASEETTKIPETREFTFDKSGLFNVSTDYHTYRHTAHSVQHSNIQTDSNDLDEMLSAYGIFQLNNDCNIFGDCSMSRIFTNPQGDSVTLSVDFEQKNSEELIIMTSNAIFYIQDGLTNQPAEIDAVTFNPCINNSIIKINTTMLVTVFVDDQNPSTIGDDEVSASTIAYRTSTNEFRQDSGNVTSGSPISLPIFLNKTVTAGTLRIIGRDSVQPNIEDTIDFTFTVANDGLEVGDSECTFDVLTTEEIGEAEVVSVQNATLTVDATDNAVVNGLNGISGITGLGGTTIWLLIMIILTIGIWTISNENGVTGNGALGTIAIFNVLFILLGARLGVLSTSLVVIIVILGVVILGVFLGKFLTGVRTAE